MAKPKRRAGTTPPDRYDSFAYVERVKDMLGGFGGLLVPHRVVVYQTLERQENAFRRLAEAGISNVVLVGKPYTTPPEGIVYRCAVEDMLAHLRFVDELAELDELFEDFTPALSRSVFGMVLPLLLKSRNQLSDLIGDCDM